VLDFTSFIIIKTILTHLNLKKNVFAVRRVFIIGEIRGRLEIYIEKLISEMEGHLSVVILNKGLGFRV
jgi:hypothetical protein